VWQAETALPTEEKLCRQFAVSRITVRRALADLQAQGLVERRHGLGTFVRGDPAAAASATAPTLNFVDTLRLHAETTQVRVIEVLRAEPPADVAAALQLSPGELALHAVRLRLIDDVPVMMTDAWIPDRLGRKITASALKKHALYEILMAQGVRFGRVVQEITAVAADPRPAMHLGTEPGVPLLKLFRLLHDTDARPVQHLVALMPPERGRVLMDIRGEQVNTLAAGYIVHNK
jgi:GntR family transcriptional regulator